MKFYLEKRTIHSLKDQEAIDITAEVQEVIRRSHIKSGQVLVMTMHTSSGLLVTEGIPCLEEDILTHFSRIFPETEDYHHRRYLDFDGRIGFNADAHLKSIMGGIQIVFAIENGELVKGGRQTIYFMEYDGPLERTYIIQVFGE